MFFHVSIHRPKAGKEQDLIGSMHRFSAALTGVPGLQEAHTLRDSRTGALMGLTIWDSEDAWDAAVPKAMEAVKDDPFDEWDADIPDAYHFEVV